LEDVTSHAIDLIEAAYSLEGSDSDWLAHLIDVGAPVLDHGQGIFAFNYVHPARNGGGADVGHNGLHLRSLPTNFLDRLDAARAVIPPEVFHAITLPGFAGTWTEVCRDHPEISPRFLELLGYSDMFAIFACDPNAVGVFIGAPLSAAKTLSPKSREVCQMVAAHIASAFRLRHALKETGMRPGGHSTGFPEEAEAVFDASGFRLIDSLGPAKEATAAEILRAAARSVDAARPRGLTEQERQVVAYVALGERNKLVAYRLGLSPSRISSLLRRAMRKLGVKSRAALIHKVRPMGVPAAMDDEPVA